MSVDLDIKGLDKVYEVLRGLPYEMSAAVVRQSMKEVERKEVLPNLKAGPFIESTKKRFITEMGKSNEMSVTVGPSYRAYWLRYIEKGTKDRYTKRYAKKVVNQRKVLNNQAKRFTGRVSAQHNIEPILDRSIENVEKRIRESFADIISKYVEKIKRK